mmetsp:Transcript_6314/g.14935  ORF Transcript_6314/g.14935 Transcript_6314/m.14935 type:complete len:306 (+) Transcript_6314:116-1033(+)
MLPVAVLRSLSMVSSIVDISVMSSLAGFVVIRVSVVFMNTLRVNALHFSFFVEGQFGSRTVVDSIVVWVRSLLGSLSFLVSLSFLFLAGLAALSDPCVGVFVDFHNIIGSVCVVGFDRNRCVRSLRCFALLVSFSCFSCLPRLPGLPGLPILAGLAGLELAHSLLVFDVFFEVFGFLRSSGNVRSVILVCAVGFLQLPKVLVDFNHFLGSVLSVGCNHNRLVRSLLVGFPCFSFFGGFWGFAFFQVSDVLVIGTVGTIGFSFGGCLQSSKKLLGAGLAFLLGHVIADKKTGEEEGCDGVVRLHFC